MDDREGRSAFGAASAFAVLLLSSPARAQPGPDPAGPQVQRPTSLAPVPAPEPAPSPTAAPAPTPPAEPPPPPAEVPPPPADAPPISAPPVIAPAPAPATVTPTPTSAPTATPPAGPRKRGLPWAWRKPGPPPRLVLAGGPSFGPHVLGVEECLGASCRRAGGFLAVGANLELRVQLYRYLYAHARVIVAGNVVREHPVHTGLVAPGVGLGGMFHRAFVRAEYLLELPFGSSHFAPPWVNDRDKFASDTWNLHAAMISAGGRLPVADRVRVEIWGGVVVGPKARRDLRPPDLVEQDVGPQEVENRVLVSFVASLGVSYDVLR